jgi:hypothetical protein
LELGGGVHCPDRPSAHTILSEEEYLWAQTTTMMGRRVESHRLALPTTRALVETTTTAERARLAMTAVRIVGRIRRPRRPRSLRLVVVVAIRLTSSPLD